MVKCKHTWHFMEKYFRQVGGSINPKGWFEAEFICDKCGESKSIKVKGTEQGETCSNN